MGRWSSVSSSVSGALAKIHHSRSMVILGQQLGQTAGRLGIPLATMVLFQAFSLFGFRNDFRYKTSNAHIGGLSVMRWMTMNCQKMMLPDLHVWPK